ncbi:MAG: hypothetical protein IKH14_02775 [Prevotella sp.]|nr:hypothetical protein [Prevotella sp.]
MHMNVSEYRPQRIAEMAEFYRFAEAVWNIPEIEPEKIADNSGYIGKHGENVSVYDAMMAEIYAEKERRLRKFERTHHADNSKKDETKTDRKRNKKIRMRKMYGLDAFEDMNHGKTVFYWDTKGGQKKFPEYEAEIFRNLKERSAEKSARADWEIEQRNIADDDERMQIEAEIREYERKQAIEQANALAWMAMQDWLEWA